MYKRMYIPHIRRILVLPYPYLCDPLSTYCLAKMTNFILLYIKIYYVHFGLNHLHMNEHIYK
jgi:hypothetical protein